MGRIKLRFWGSEKDCMVFKNFVEDMPTMVSCSRLYKNRPPSTEYRVYAELDLPEADSKPRLEE